jgi:hypothetical protein
MQARLGQLSLRTAIMWMCGEDLACPTEGMPAGWEEARDKLGGALIEAQKIVGRRVKIGTIWVSFCLQTLHRNCCEPDSDVSGLISAFI